MKRRSSGHNEVKMFKTYFFLQLCIQPAVICPWTYTDFDGFVGDCGANYLHNFKQISVKIATYSGYEVYMFLTLSTGFVISAVLWGYW